MPRWSDIEEEAPGIVSAARRFLDTGVHKTIATVRRDGSPRVSGTEIILAEGELWFGSMWRSTKALDLLRDPRFALHSASADPPAWAGDATVSGQVEEVSDPAVIDRVVGDHRPPGPLHLFRADITEISVVTLGDPADHLVIESWCEGRGARRRKRC